MPVPGGNGGKVDEFPGGIVGMDGIVGIVGIVPFPINIKVLS